MDKSDDLQHLYRELQALKTKYQKNLSIDSGLIMRYDLPKKSSSSESSKAKVEV